MIKVLGFARYGPLAASTRYRLRQYIPGLAAMGIDLTVCHLLGDDYLRHRFNGGHLPIGTVLNGAINRLINLRDLGNYDLAVVYCELFPLMPAWLERMLTTRPYIYDFDDAFYLKYRKASFRGLRPILSNKFDNVIRGARAVTAGSQVLSNYALRFNKNTLLLPTVVDTSRYLPLRDRNDGKLTIGWIGSPSTAPYLSQLVRPLSALGREGPLRFIVIGGPAPFVPGVEVIEIPWQEDSEVELLNQFDVGVMPLPSDEWARGKCAFKLIQYMACGIPVIASPIGANVDVVSSDCGFLAGSDEDWLQALRFFRDNHLVRRRMGEAGRARVIDHYSLARNLVDFAATIRQVAST